MFSGGKGTEKDPFIIETVQDLINVRVKNMEYPFYHYRQNGNIDLIGVEWLPIGNPTLGGPPFMGVYDGGGWKIMNLTITQNIQYGGLFGVCTSNTDGEGNLVSRCILKNIHLENGNITNGNWVALLTAVASWYVLIENCLVHGKINIESEESTVAGLCVNAEWKSVISKCGVDIDLTGGRVGGFCLYPSGGESINNCYVRGRVRAYGGVFEIGDYGIFGKVEIIENCYSNVVLDAGNEGSMHVFNADETSKSCYFDAILLVENSWTLGADYYFSPFFVKGTDGLVYSITNTQFGTDYTGSPWEGDPNYNPNYGGPYYDAQPILGMDWQNYWEPVLNNDEFPEARTTSQMLTQSNYVGWDFETIWQWIEGDYPKLRFPLPRKIKKCKAMKLGALRGRR